jgi:hypothetical protein
MPPIMVHWKMRGMKEDSPMATYHVIREQILARVPGIDPADISSLLRMLVSESRGPQWRGLPQVRHALAGLETLWVEEIADLQEAIAAQRQDGLTRGLTEPETEAEILASLRQDFMRGEIPRPSSSCCHPDSHRSFVPMRRID